MRITSLQLKNFKRFETFSGAFGPGINVVRGENEQGKSTLLKAILAGLFLDPTKRNKAITSLQRWGSEDLYRIDLGLENNGATYELTKDFQEKFFNFKDVASAKNYTTIEEAAQLLRSLVGTDSVKFFRSTAAVQQDALTEIHEGKKELEQAIQQFVTSGGDQTSAVEVLRILEKTLKEKEKGLDRPTVTPGVLRKLQDERTQLTGQIQELEAVVVDRARRQTENEEARALLRQKKEEQAVRERVLADAAKQQELAQKRTALEERFKDIEQVWEALQKAEGADTTNVDAQLSSLVRINEQLRDVASQQAALQQHAQPQQNATGPNKAFLVSAGVLALVGIAGAFVSPWIMLALLPAIALGVLAFRGSAGAKAEANEQAQREGALTQKRAALLQEAGVKHEDALKEQIQRLQTQRETQMKETAAREALLKGRTEEQIKEERSVVARELVKLEEQEKTIGPSELDPQKRAAMQREYDQAAKDIEQLTKTGIENRARIDATPASYEELLQLQERLVEVEEELQREQLLTDAHRLAIEVIQTSKDSVTKKAKGILQELMEAYLPRITQNRYAAAHVDDSLAITVETGEQQGGVITPDEVLSRGTIDQIYLVARLALIKLLYQDAKPPLFFDDPFTTFDSARRNAAMHVLQEFSQEHQIFLFTHTDAYDPYASNVIQLGAPVEASVE